MPARHRSCQDRAEEVSPGSSVANVLASSFMVHPLHDDCGRGKWRVSETAESVTKCEVVERTLDSWIGPSDIWDATPGRKVWHGPCKGGDTAGIDGEGCTPLPPPTGCAPRLTGACGERQTARRATPAQGASCASRPTAQSGTSIMWRAIA